MKAFPLPLFIAAIIFSPLAVKSAGPTPDQKAAQQIEEMKALRKKAAHQPRRVLYNDDGLEPKPYKTPEELLAMRVKQVANTQVDSIFYCTGGGGMFWGHQAKVGEVLGQFVTDSSGAGPRATRDGLEALKALGTDPLTEVIKFGHNNKMEVFWSYRMNNPEDSFVDWGLSERKRKHPTYLMGKKSDWNPSLETDPKVWWALEDFSHSEVRDYIVQIFEDVCKRYDIDGIELDFIRHPLFFRPNLKGSPATGGQVKVMTEMVRSIRAMTERVALERGRPILVTAHVPLSVESGLAVGLDVPTYLKEGLVDILVVGQDYVQMGVASDLKTMVDLGHKYEVPVYALLAPPKPYKLYADSKAWYGAAMNRFYWGADGIYTFNLFPRSPDIKFSEFGSKDSLKGKDKIYGIDNPAAESILGTFKLAVVAPDRLPIALQAGQNAPAKLSVGEDIVANTPSGKAVSALLHLKLSSLDKSQQVGVRFNGQPLGSPVLQGDMYEVEVDPKIVRPGYNNIELKLNRGHNVSVDLLNLMVSYK